MLLHCHNLASLDLAAQEKRICLKASAEELCENAVQLFRKICGQIVDKTVTIKDMEVLNDHIQEQVSGSADLSKYVYNYIV